MKSVGWYITKLLVGSLVVSIVLSGLVGRHYGLGDSHDGVYIIAIFISPFLQFILSLAAYINVKKKWRNNGLLRLLSFLFLPLILVLNVTYVRYEGMVFEDVSFFDTLSELIMIISPYVLFMLISSILFRRFCRRELGE